MAVAAYLRDHVVPLLIGRDAARIEDTWQYLYRGAYWRRGPVTMAAIAAVDTALWDIKAKAAGMPLYQLLGGAPAPGRWPTATPRAGTSRSSSTPYARTSSRASGPSASRPASRVSTRSTVAASSAGGGERYDYEPRAAAGPRSLPVEETWDTRAYLRHLPRRLRSRPRASSARSCRCCTTATTG